MEKEKTVRRWETCMVGGWITPVEPGCLCSASYPMEYRHDELRVGQNLSSHNERLPSVVVEEIAEDHIVLFAGGQRHTIYTGETYTTPKKGLNNAYSEVVVRLE